MLKLSNGQDTIFKTLSLLSSFKIVTVSYSCIFKIFLKLFWQKWRYFVKILFPRRFSPKNLIMPQTMLTISVALLTYLHLLSLCCQKIMQQSKVSICISKSFGSNSCSALQQSNGCALGSQPRWASAFTGSLPLCFSRWRIKFVHSFIHYKVYDVVFCVLWSLNAVLSSVNKSCRTFSP